MRGQVIEEVSFEELLRELEPRFRAVLARFQIPEQDAEDLVQQALLAYVRKCPTVLKPEAWLLGTLRNRCLRYWRARRRRLYTAVDTAILEGVASEGAPSQEQVDLRRDLNGAMGRLRPRCRSILGLRYGMGCEPRETARRLGYKESSIYKLMERCLAALSNQLLASERTRVC